MGNKPFTVYHNVSKATSNIHDAIKASQY